MPLAKQSRTKRRLSLRYGKKRSRRSSYKVGAGFGQTLFSNALKLASNPNMTHGVLSTATRLAPVAAKLGSFSPQGAMISHAFSAASPYLQQFQRDPQGAVRSVMSSPIGQQVLSHVSAHLPYVQQQAASYGQQPVFNPNDTAIPNYNGTLRGPYQNVPARIAPSQTYQYQQNPPQYSAAPTQQWQQSGGGRRKRSNKTRQRKLKTKGASR